MPATASPVWTALNVPGVEPARYAFEAGEITVESRGAASFLYRELTPTEQAARTLSWRWRVDTGIPAADLRTRGADDRDLAVHIWFSAPQGSGGLLKWLKDRFVLVFGFPITGRTLTYVWGGRDKRGESFANPTTRRTAGS